jgi:predicted transposase YbfD/YdcC
MEDAMATSFDAPVSLLHHFAKLDDPRSDHTKLHNLLDIIALTLCAVVSGSENWTDIEAYGDEKLPWLETFLDLPNGIPSHDTLGRLFASLNPSAFQECFLSWMHAVVGASNGKLVAIDGKTLRRSFDTAKGKSALHLVSAWASENHVLLGQQAVSDKSNEITAIPALLKLLDLQGALVTLDAMGCQKRITEDIVAGGADYVLAVKKNQPTLHEDIERVFVKALETDFAHVSHRALCTKDKGHGRRETRQYYLVEVPQELARTHSQFVGLKTLGMVMARRQVGEGAETVETRFYISSLGLKVKKFAEAVRGHWSIENNLHWMLDVVFDEDGSRLRKDHGPENLGLVRRIALSMLKKANKKHGLACRRKRAGWNDDFLAEVLLGAG